MLRRHLLQSEHLILNVGDLIKYMTGCIAVVLCINDAGGTVKVLNVNGNIRWLVASDCEVISASR